MQLREPAADDTEAVRAYFERNASRLQQWGAGTATIAAARRREWVEWRNAQAALGHTRSFLVFIDSTLAGIVDLDGISAGPPAMAMLGYSIDASFEGRGLAGEAVGSVVRYAFDVLHLEVLTAYYHPGNARSGALLARAGFEIQSAVVDVPPELRDLMNPQIMAVLPARAWRDRAAKSS
ncbi:MAG: GNAT family N-acetyltransferase [Vulcanimicrobiaceae bacterium]